MFRLQNQFTGKRLILLVEIRCLLVRRTAEIQKEVQSLLSNILHIKKIVAMQQCYVGVSEALEALNIEDLAEDPCSSIASPRPVGSKWSGNIPKVTHFGG